MSGLAFAALVLCLHITAGESQQFTIIIEHSQINVTAGGEALLSVRPSGNDSSGSWTLNGIIIAQWIGQTEILDPEYTSRAELFTSNRSLLLKSVNSADSGEYRVNMVPNSGSMTSATVTLRVTEPVTRVAVVTNNSTPLENLDTVALSCVASGSVQTRTWFKDNQPIQGNGRIFTSPDKAKLTIISVNRNDVGTYKCIARNSFSSGAGETYVEVYCKYTAKTDGNCTLGSGAIVGILLGLLGMGLIGGVNGWLIARKSDGINDPPQSQDYTSVNSGRKSTVDTNTVNASGTYENLSRNEQGARNDVEDGNSTYTGLVLQDRSVYSGLER
ncbi:carcinoembryonic antigen-related cell adhesion molecule 7-like [Hypanus sabinus]|uniref:carcinoembryonic antigen-related cell adhesion molecule 7-like n=1 Tax=Hypanus sabinus TaxID=79690 RepID=UPI0028C46975|nr:carcinoembryonic antigen-related cell adhesion molecule 7-like [Hypanus sabinus]